MEREYVEKYRDLKAQDKRRRESLELEKEEFERYRREKGKELADREERLRRNVENKEEKVRVSTESLRELEELRKQVKEHEAGEWRRKKEMAEMDARVVASRGEAQVAKGLLAWSLVAFALATLGWLALSWESVAARLLATASSLAVVVLAWRRSRIRGAG